MNPVIASLNGLAAHGSNNFVIDDITSDSRLSGILNHLRVGIQNQHPHVAVHPGHILEPVGENQRVFAAVRFAGGNFPGQIADKTVGFGDALTDPVIVPDGKEILTQEN